VALRTRNRRMGPGQREGRFRMVEYRATPVRRTVADRTIQWEVPLHVVRIRGPLVISQMATVAIARQCREIAIGMALRTRNRSVHTGQRETPYGIVIEAGGRPIGRRMAQRAVNRKARLHVIRIGRRFIVREMAGVAILRRTRESALRMALVALHRHVKASQRKLCLRMVKRRSSPIRRRMALRAILQKSSRLVIRVIGSLKIAKMAADAGGWRTHELVVLMASDACHRRMRASQRKTKSTVVHLGV